MLNDGRVSGIREPHEGHEELEAIPHAFAVEFNDGEDAWAIFCDNNEDKASLEFLRDGREKANRSTGRAYEPSIESCGTLRKLIYTIASGLTVSDASYTALTCLLCVSSELLYYSSIF